MPETMLHAIMPLPKKVTFALLALAAAAAACAALIAITRSEPSHAPATRAPVTRAPGPGALAFSPMAIGASVEEFQRPWVTSVQIDDLDQDGLVDVLYCEAQLNTVRWIRQSPLGSFREIVIAEETAGPAHVWTADVNGSGRKDVLVACMGRILPNNDRIGSVVVLENLDNRTFRKRIVLQQIARVSDVRAANLAGHRDGRLDLVVGQFGYNQGETRWLENKGGWRFETHIVSTLSGCIHVPVADFDGDGNDDFAALISQEWEELHLFRGHRDGTLGSRVIWGSTNEDFGSSGLSVAEVNGDGRPDLVYTNGDGFDYADPGPRRWQGMQWLENRGDGTFAYRRVADFGGAFGPCAADLNGDGFVDLLAVSCFGDWTKSDSPSMMAWLNDGQQNFTPVVLAYQPIHLITAAVGDIDQDGVPEIVTGGFHNFAPWDHMSNITLWCRK